MPLKKVLKVLIELIEFIELIGLIELIELIESIELIELIELKPKTILTHGRNHNTQISSEQVSPIILLLLHNTNNGYNPLVPVTCAQLILPDCSRHPRIFLHIYL